MQIAIDQDKVVKFKMGGCSHTECTHVIIYLKNTTNYWKIDTLYTRIQGTKLVKCNTHTKALKLGGNVTHKVHRVTNYIVQQGLTYR